MPCYRCGVRQTDPGRGQSPWKRGVRRQSQILICPGCQDTVDWMSEMDRCSRCSSVHLVKRLGEVECRDCGAIVTPEGPGETGLAEPGFTEAGLAEAPGGEPGAAPGGAGPVVAGRGPDLSEEVARALDRVLSRSLVSQSLVSQSVQRAAAPEGRSGGGSGAGSGSGSGAGRHRPVRGPADHVAAHPGAFAG